MPSRGRNHNAPSGDDIGVTDCVTARCDAPQMPGVPAPNSTRVQELAIDEGQFTPRVVHRPD